LGTIAEKVLVCAAGVDRVEPGVIVDAFPDLVMSHTATWRSVDVMRQLGADRLYDPSRIAIVLDHVAPTKTEKYAADQRTSRQFARDYGIEKFYDVDAGIAHLVLMRKGMSDRAIWSWARIRIALFMEPLGRSDATSATRRSLRFG